jgi:putative NIF3 family GTP cyclohydrolase 1 type 2
VGDFFASGAQVYISGDLRYHDAREVEIAGKGLIDIGHFASEHLVVEVLARNLAESLNKSGGDISVEACRLEEDPFKTIL